MVFTERIFLLTLMKSNSIIYLRSATLGAGLRCISSLTRHPEPEHGVAECGLHIAIREGRDLLRRSYGLERRLSLGRASGSSFQLGSSCHSRLKSAQSGFSARISFSFFSRRQPLISISLVRALAKPECSSYQTNVSNSYRAVKLSG